MRLFHPKTRPILLAPRVASIVSHTVTTSCHRRTHRELPRRFAPPFCEPTRLSRIEKRGPRIVAPHAPPLGGGVGRPKGVSHVQSLNTRSDALRLRVKGRERAHGVARLVRCGSPAAVATTRHRHRHQPTQGGHTYDDEGRRDAGPRAAPHRRLRDEHCVQWHGAGGGGRGRCIRHAEAGGHGVGHHGREPGRLAVPRGGPHRAAGVV